MKILYLTNLDWEFDPEGTLPIGATCDIKKVDKIPYSLLSNGYLFKTYLSLKGLDLDYDVIHYITERLNFQKATDSDLRGRHNRIGGKSYCRSFIRENYEIKFIEGKDTAVDRRRGGDMKQRIYTPLHENLHAKSDIVGKKDVLHEWVALGKFNEYDKEYLEEKVKPQTVPEVDNLLPLVERKWKAFEAIMQQLNDPIVLVEGYRSPEKQQMYYEQGGITNAQAWESMHQYRIALDYRFKNAPIYPPSQHNRWKIANQVATFLGFYSYGKELGWDDGHIQVLLDYKERDFRDGKVDYGKYN